MNYNRLAEVSSNGRAHYEEKPPKRIRTRDRILKPKTDNQQAYMEAIEEKDIIFCLGPAGTGKTHVAAGMAAKLFFNFELLRPDKEVRIIGVRPAVEVGNRIGFLPGEIDDKLDPYLKPLFNELSKFIPREELRKYRLGDFPRIEISPLQFMRGWTFEDSVVILDEAQNATRKELDMFLTRIGYGTKLIINGDTSRDSEGNMMQCDLPYDEQGALEEAAKDLCDMESVAVITMTEADSVRHPLVKEILRRRTNRNRGHNTR